MVIISIIAIIIASLSLGFSLIQWVSRHRPYIGIVNLKFATIYEESLYEDIVLPDSVRCTIKNVGEAPARKVYLSGTVKARSVAKEPKQPKERIIEPRELGVYLPGQEAEVVLSFDIYSAAQDFASGYGAVEIDSQITYEGPLLLFLDRLHRRKYRTTQKYLVMQSPDRWVALSGGDWT